jgi:hypothetical protein
MELSDYEAKADYWLRQVELYPENEKIRAVEIIAVADYLIQSAFSDT